MAATEVSIYPAIEWDARQLAARLRPAEVDELMAATGEEPLPALVDAVRQSDEAQAIYFNGELACIWGVVKHSETLLGGRMGTVWLLSSSVVERHAKTFWKLCLELVPKILERWDILFNFIDERHGQAVRWAKRLGFRLDGPSPYGVAGMPFCAFRVTKEDLCALQP
jgi:hypothetical protein